MVKNNHPKLNKYLTFNKKGSIGLSVEMLVVVIISIVILTSGIVMLKGFIEKTDQTKNLLDQKVEAELEKMLIDDGKQVAIARKTADIERGGNYVFGIGIMNTKKDVDSFHPKVQFKTATDAQNKGLEIDSAEIEKWLLYDLNSQRIKQWENDKIGILVSVPEDAIKGEYIFNARIYEGETEDESIQYGNTQQIIVNVK